MAIYMIPEVQRSEAAQSAVTSLLIGFYSISIGAEFWQGRDDALASRLPLAFLCGLNGFIHLARVVAAFVLPNAPAMVGTNLWVAFSLFQPALIMVAGGLYGIGLGRDRTELELRRTAEIDSLTGVLNRGALMERMQRLIAELRHEPVPVALLIFDLDRFKSINDSYGHVTGDRVLAVFGEAVKECLRGTDLVGRLGGEEFAAVLPGLETATASAVAERVRREFARRRPSHEGMTVLATVSIGVASLPARHADVDRLISLADQALYDAKRSGRDQVREAALAIAC
jgi:diguanylate cyclase (GGDEF)-like protein